MEGKEFFKRSVNNQLSAANIGINKDNWSFISTSAYAQNKEEAFTIMKENRFDILPLLKNNDCKFYVSTEQWNCFSIDKISQKEIQPNEDCIYYLTHVKDLIRLFVNMNRNYFFLTNHTEIVGLITIGDLNNKFFYYYLYQKLVELEKNLSSFLTKNVGVETILFKVEELSSENTSLSEWFNESLNRYKEDVINGTDTVINEYLYLGQYIHLICSFSLFKSIGYKNVDALKNGTKALNEIRKTIAHPTRSIISESNSIMN